MRHTDVLQRLMELYWACLVEPRATGERRRSAEHALTPEIIAGNRALGPPADSALSVDLAGSNRILKREADAAIHSDSFLRRLASFVNAGEHSPSSALMASAPSQRRGDRAELHGELAIVADEEARADDIRRHLRLSRFVGPERREVRAWSEHAV